MINMFNNEATNNDYQLRPLATSDSRIIAELHKECFPKSFSTTLGLKGLTEFYSYLFTLCDDLCFGVFFKGKLIAFLYGDLSIHDATTFTKTHKWLIIRRTFVNALLFKRVVWKKIFTSIKSMFKKLTKRKKQVVATTKNEESVLCADLLSIACSESFRGSGISKRLVDAFENKVKEKGLPYYRLAVAKNNPRAIAFYEKMGMIRFHEGEDGYFYKKLV